VSGNVVMCGVKFIWCAGMDDEMNLVCDVKCLIMKGTEECSWEGMCGVYEVCTYCAD
jgi:hypothetical protein